MLILTAIAALGGLTLALASMLVVANRKLPYEAELAGRGVVEVRTQAEGYKIIEFVTG